MQFTSRKTSLVLLGATALTCSRILFFLFHDPEGPNLLIVTVLAMILYVASFLVWRFIPASSAGTKLLLGISTQVVIVAGLYTIS